MSTSDLIPPLEDLDLSEFETQSPKLIDDVSLIARPTSPPMRAPAYALRGLNNTGNESLDRSLNKTGFKPQVFFQTNDSKQIVMLYGVDAGNYQILIRMDQEGMVMPSELTLSLVEEPAEEWPLANNDLQALQLVVEGLGYFRDGGRLYYANHTSNHQWAIQEVERRPLPSDLPVPIVRYTTLVSNPLDTQTNVRLAIDAILADRYRLAKNSVVESTKYLIDIYEAGQDALRTSMITLNALYLSLTQLYILRARFNPEFRHEHNQEIVQVLSYKNWDKLDNNQKEMVADLGRQAIRTKNTQNTDHIKYKTIIKNIAIRVNKIDETLQDIKSLTRLINGVDQETISTLSDNLRELSRESWQIIAD